VSCKNPLLLLSFGLVVSATLPSQLRAADADDQAFWDSVYVENHVLDIEITVSQKAWEEMQPVRSSREGGRGGFGNEYPFAHADIVIDGERFSDAGLRFKGNSSFRFAGNSLKKPFKIDTNRYVKGQKLHGRTKLNLSNAFLDSAFMKEKLGYELYRAAGMPTPGVGWANVSLQIEGSVEKQPLGLYVLVEQMDDNYIERSFGAAAKDSLLMKPEEFDDWEYLGDDLKNYERYNIKTGETNAEQIKQFADLLQLIENGSDEEFEAEIGKRMDLKQFAGYLAATSILASVDSYIGMPHNYYLLLDKTDGKLRLLPWDLNETFGTFTMGSSPEDLLQWDVNYPWVAYRLLLERLSATESFPPLYRATLKTLVENDFTEEKVFARIDEFEKVLRPYLADKDGKTPGLTMGIDGDPEGLNRAVERRVYAIKPFVTRRIESIRAQLAGESNGVRIYGRRR
jgi:spore coat protein H